MAIGWCPGQVACLSKLIFLSRMFLPQPELGADSVRYTKRALLAGVIGTTELFMITDFSPGYADTWASLDRRLRDVTQLGKAASQVQSMAEFVMFLKR